MAVILNQKRPQLIETNIDLDWSDVPVQMYKYEKVTPKLLSQLDKQTLEIVDRMYPWTKHGYRNLLLDVKVLELKKGECGCKLPFWHIDVTKNPNHHSKYDNHLIFSTIVGTEFMLTPIKTDTEDFTTLDLQGEVWQAPVNSIVKYDRLNVHRGPKMPMDCKRVLIRLTQTDII